MGRFTGEQPGGSGNKLRTYRLNFALLKFYVPCESETVTSGVDVTVEVQQKPTDS